MSPWQLHPGNPEKGNRSMLIKLEGIVTHTHAHTHKPPVGVMNNNMQQCRTTWLSPHKHAPPPVTLTHINSAESALPGTPTHTSTWKEVVRQDTFQMSQQTHTHPHPQSGLSTHTHNKAFLFQTHTHTHHTLTLTYTNTPTLRKPSDKPTHTHTIKNQ